MNTEEAEERAKEQLAGIMPGLELMRKEEERLRWLAYKRVVTMGVWIALAVLAGVMIAGR